MKSILHVLCLKISLLPLLCALVCALFMRQKATLYLFMMSLLGNWGICPLCPTLRHVPSKHRATNLDLIFDNEGTKPFPSSVLDYFIEDNSCHYEQLSSDMSTNRAFKIDFRKKNPAFKKENPGLRWHTTRDSATRSNTQAKSDPKNRLARIGSV